MRERRRRRKRRKREGEENKNIKHLVQHIIFGESARHR
jgi:hypothetical protein